MRKQGLTEEAATASIDQACRMLRLPTIRQQFKEMADSASVGVHVNVPSLVRMKRDSC